MDKIEIEKVQDKSNAVAKKPEDVTAKKGKEVQIHSGAETANDSPEITVLSQAADSDGGVVSSSEDEEGNVHNKYYAFFN